MLAFFVFGKSGIINSCSYFGDQNTKFHGPTLAGASFAPTSAVLKSHHRHIQKVRPNNNY
jgi:hypothetical protein